jgi:hypothetical protein
LQSETVHKEVAAGLEACDATQLQAFRPARQHPAGGGTSS